MGNLRFLPCEVYVRYMNFEKPRSEEKELSQEQKELINNTTLIIPNNDGEAALTIKIAKQLGLDVRVSNQSWGARLDKELEQNPEILSRTKKNVWVFEMPSKELEEKLKKEGVNIEIIDHHSYEEDDRSKEKSSLEQFLEMLHLNDEQIRKLGFDPRFVHGIAINDRDYIYGLRDAGYSRDEIEKIREFDMRAQMKEKYQSFIERNEEIYNNRREENGIIILETIQGDNNSFAVDKIVLENEGMIPSILDLRRGNDGNIHFIYFSGPIDTVRKITYECHPTFHSSLDGREKSAFVGWVEPSKEELREIEKTLGVSIT